MQCLFAQSSLGLDPSALVEEIELVEDFGDGALHGKALPLRGLRRDVELAGDGGRDYGLAVFEEEV